MRITPDRRLREDSGGEQPRVPTQQIHADAGTATAGHQQAGRDAERFNEGGRVVRMELDRPRGDDSQGAPRVSASVVRHTPELPREKSDLPVPDIRIAAHMP